MISSLLLFAAGVVGGALNSVAGGGSFIGLPTLLLVGVSPVVANATTTMALWPGSVSAVFAYRRELGATRSVLLPLSVVSLVGGLFGGILLVRTSDSSFLRLLPWLMLIAAVTFTVGGRFRAGVSGAPNQADRLPPWTLPVQFVIALYGGFFGGGMGIMMLAVMALIGMTDIHEMNGLKTVLAVALNAVALAAFVVAGSIAWRPGFIMMVGAIAGGYGGAAIARTIDRGHIRGVVIIVAWTMTIYFFVR